MKYGIFSRCFFTTYGLKFVLSDIMKNISDSYHIVTHSDLKKNIDPRTKLIIVDITSFNRLDMISFLFKVRELSNSKVVILCEEYMDCFNLPEYYNAIVYKKESVLKIKKLLYAFISGNYESEIFGFDTYFNRKEELTDREKETLTYAIFGMDNSKIAEILSISPKTVSAHRRSICRKLKVKSISYYSSKFNYKNII
ncbi:LuxR family transcriptional regulatory protein [Yersinia intermedia]|uniref:helix-turn-helix transcriptional regulator n=1 Tax=Yersinia intermedia TaxID=631 RepID=UPI0005E5E82C|nr:LuxR C-terminal-related transcriptional regulator [Yersinia intermedia]CND13505.1 LuxR family transcriptional regulatory protein [Yersinia intermedia]CNH39080.1 LuxR family transcriptional regulatory protein [Yersinia intermedia]